MIFAVGAGARAKPTVLELALQIFENATTDEMKAKLMLMVLGFVAINVTNAMLGEDGNESGEGAEPDSKKGKGDDDEAFKPAAPPGWAMAELLKLCKIAAEIEFQLTPDPYATSTYDYKSIPVPVIHNIRGAMVAILRNSEGRKLQEQRLFAEVFAHHRRSVGRFRTAYGGLWGGYPPGGGVTREV
jgi:hypothetical protein